MMSTQQQLVRELEERNAMLQLRTEEMAQRFAERERKMQADELRAEKEEDAFLHYETAAEDENNKLNAQIAYYKGLLAAKETNASSTTEHYHIASDDDETEEQLRRIAEVADDVTKEDPRKDLAEKARG